MIQAGLAGGSALQQAAQRRAAAERLLHEVRWLEALAADEKAIAAQLLELPPAYALLHDLRLPGSTGNVDHLVVGPGGAFVVVGRRCVEPISFRDGTLWVGESTLNDALVACKVESQSLTQTIGTTVVPVLALLGSQPPASLPHAIGGVLVCAADNVVRVIARASHTLLPPHKVSEAVERALPLLNNAGSEVRTESVLDDRAEAAAGPSTTPVAPDRGPPPDETIEARRVTYEATQERGVNIAHAVPTVQAQMPAQVQAQMPAQVQAQAPARVPLALDEAVAESLEPGRSGHSRSFLFTVVTLLVLCVVALAVGLLARFIWNDDSGDELNDGAPSVTDQVTEVPTGLSADVAAPSVVFVPLCPSVGAGWQLQPQWPGDVANLRQYDIELQNPDGTWMALEPLATPQSPWGSLVGQPAGAAFTVRITAVMTDASRSISAPTVVTAPAEAC